MTTENNKDILLLINESISDSLNLAFGINSNLKKEVRRIDRLKEESKDLFGKHNGFYIELCSIREVYAAGYSPEINWLIDFLKTTDFVDSHSEQYCYWKKKVKDHIRQLSTFKTIHCIELEKELLRLEKFYLSIRELQNNPVIGLVNDLNHSLKHLDNEIHMLLAWQVNKNSFVSRDSNNRGGKNTNQENRL